MKKSRKLSSLLGPACGELMMETTAAILPQAKKIDSCESCWKLAWRSLWSAAARRRFGMPFGSEQNQPPMTPWPSLPAIVRQVEGYTKAASSRRTPQASPFPVEKNAVS